MLSSINVVLHLKGRHLTHCHKITKITETIPKISMARNHWSKCCRNATKQTVLCSISYIVLFCFIIVPVAFLVSNSAIFSSLTYGDMIAGHQHSTLMPRSLKLGSVSALTNKTLTASHVTEIRTIKCANLFKNVKDEIARAVSLEKRSAADWARAYDTLTVDFITVNSCATLRKRYSSSRVSNDEKSFPLAFTLIVYEQLAQVEALLRAVYRPHNFYCIHVDKKAAVMFRNSLVKLAGCLDNVYVSDRSVDVRWGTYSVLDADVTCMRVLLEKSSRWKYVINLSTYDFPLKTNLELVRILKAFNGSNNIEGILKRQHGGDRDRYKYVYTERGKRTEGLKTAPPHNVSVVKGAIHIVATREFIHFALTDRRARDLLDWLRDAHVPDEMFFSTLNFNTHLAAPGAYLGGADANNDKLPHLFRWKQWQWYGYKCQGSWRHSICCVGPGDLHMLNQPPQLFLNKVLLAHNPVAFHCLQELISNRTAQGHISVNISHYSKLDFVSNHI